jgi:hypothetical protein
MTLDTLSLRDMSISSHHIDMAPFTGHASCNIFPMIEVPTFDLNVPFGFDVARGASSYSTRDTFLLPSWSSIVIVADDAVNFMNGEMFSLYELGVTGGASKFHPPSQFLYMFPVREGYILIDHILREFFNSMASLLKATRIINLRVGPARFLTREEVGQRDLTIDPFTPQMIEKSRLVVAFCACHMTMARGSPRFHISVHLVTEATES